MVGKVNYEDKLVEGGTEGVATTVNANTIPSSFTSKIEHFLVTLPTGVNEVYSHHPSTERCEDPTLYDYKRLTESASWPLPVRHMPSPHIRTLLVVANTEAHQVMAHRHGTESQVGAPSGTIQE